MVFIFVLLFFLELVWESVILFYILFENLYFLDIIQRENWKNGILFSKHFLESTIHFRAKFAYLLAQCL